MTGWTAAIPGWVASAARLGRITGSLATRRYCLGSPLPARRPRPAATTIAATMPAMSVSKIGNATMALAVSAGARKPDLESRQDPFTGPFILWGNIALQHLRPRQFCLNYMQ